MIDLVYFDTFFWFKIYLLNDFKINILNDRLVIYYNFLRHYHIVHLKYKKEISIYLQPFSFIRNITTLILNF